MEQTGDYLFVYGTLLDEGNELADYLRNNCRFYVDGKFKGRLYHCGAYPGAVANKESPGYVYGRVFILKDFTEALTRLDDYEGYRDEQQQPNLFVREMIQVDAGQGKLNCWVYLYNLPVDGLRLIESGDYLKYKNAI